MTKKDYELIAQSVYRSGIIKDKNQVRQLAREKMRRLIASDLAGSLYGQDKRFKREQFLIDCGVTD
jgi:hypothetical protein